MNEGKIVRINEVIADFFKNNPTIEWIAAKEIMPSLIKAGVFNKDEKKGLPLRKVLRALDKDNTLDKIPFVHPERKGIDTYWYLVKEGGTYVTKDLVLPVSNKEQAKLNRENSDEYYLIGLCNELLSEEASHQHTFDFLVGDKHKRNKTRTELPLDAYYLGLNLAIEFIAAEENLSADAEKLTVSGVTRNEQRKIYAQRKRDVLAENEINLLVINYADFECDSEHKLIREKKGDVKLLKQKLKDYLKKKK